MISIIELIAQTENESRSENIKWGYRRHQLRAHQNYIIENAMAMKTTWMGN